MAKSARNASTRKRASGGSSSVLSAFDRNIGWLRAGWVLAATALAIVMLSLASFNPADPPSLAVAQPNDPPVNLCGRFGASVAYRLYEIFGVGAWIPVGYLSVWLGFIAMGRAMTHPFVRLVGAMMTLLAFGGLHNEWIPTVGPVAGYEAGLIPKALSLVVHEHFGFGATLIFLVMLGIGSVVMADSLVKKIPDAIAQALDFLGPIWKTDWSDKVGSIRERAGAIFPQPAVATAGRSRRAAAKAEDADEDGDEDEGGVATAVADDEDADEGEETDETIEDSEDTEIDAEEDEETEDEPVEETPKAAAPKKSSAAAKTAAPAPASAPAPAPVAATPAPRTDEELRAKIAKLPVKVNTKSPAKTAKDDDIPRTPDYSGYQFPTLELLDNPEGNYSEKAAQLAQEQAIVLTKTLETYGITGEISEIECGPVVTVYSVELEAGTRVARLETISKDIARALTAPNVRIIPNMAGSTAVGIEVPNKQKEKVRLKELMSGGHAQGMMLPMFMGKDSSGDPLVLDLAKMPHMLIAGTTGSGKSVCMNTIIMSFLYTKRPDELKLVLVDPKMVEMAMFADIPHLACPVVTEMGRAAAILEWAVTKMEERYELLKEAGVRDIKGFNALTEDELRAQMNVTDDGEWARVMKKMPYMVFVIDELADLMMTNKEVEQSIVRIA
ncbi:MAG: hypothetical protein RIT24_1811, partial [Planctomycetota bacterium]